MALMEYIYIASQIFFYIGVTTTIGVVLIYIVAKIAKARNIVNGIGKMFFLLAAIWLIEILLNIYMLFYYK